MSIGQGTSSRTKRRVAALASAVVLTSLVAGCAQQADEGSNTAELTTVRVGWAPAAGMANWFVADELGYFEEEGIQIEFERFQTPPAITSALAGGQVDVGAATAGGLIAAVTQSFPIAVLGPGFTEAQHISVLSDSDIQSPKDLEGRSIGMLQLGGDAHAGTLLRLEEHGVDTSKVDFVLVALPDALGALQSGQVDAAQVVEPFLARAGDSTRYVIEDIFGSHNPESELENRVMAWTTVNTDFQESNPEAADAVMRALLRVSASLSEDPDLARQVIVDVMDMDPALADAIELPIWVDKLNAEGVQGAAEAMARFGFLDSAPDTSVLFPTTWPPSGS